MCVLSRVCEFRFQMSVPGLGFVEGLGIRIFCLRFPISSDRQTERQKDGYTQAHIHTTTYTQPHISTYTHNHIYDDDGCVALPPLPACDLCSNGSNGQERLNRLALEYGAISGAVPARSGIRFLCLCTIDVRFAIARHALVSASPSLPTLISSTPSLSVSLCLLWSADDFPTFRYFPLGRLSGKSGARAHAATHCSQHKSQDLVCCLLHACAMRHDATHTRSSD